MKNHLDFLVPYTNELTLPYRTNQRLMDKIEYIFSHPYLSKQKREKYIYINKITNKTITRDMSTRAFAMAKHFLDNPSQYGHKMENIYFQILIRMWRQVYKYRKLLCEKDITYTTTEFKLLKIDNGLIEELIRSVNEDDCIWSGDDMVKVRPNKGLRESNRASLKEGDKYFEYLCTLD